MVRLQSRTGGLRWTVLVSLLSACFLGSCTGSRGARSEGLREEEGVVSGVKDGDAVRPSSGPSPHIAVKTPRVHPPRRLKNVVPAYPVNARRQGIEGVVILEITIEPNGKVSDARVLRGIDELNQAAIEAALQWEYAPPLLGGRPVSITLIVPLQFVAR